MNILVVSPYAPYPPHAGGRIRIFEEIKFLGQKHEVAVAYFVYTKRELRESLGLQEFCSKTQPVLYTDFLRIPNTIPRLVQEYISSEMVESLQELREDFKPDLAILQHIYMAYYRPWLPLFTILEEHNIESQILERSSSLLQKGVPKEFKRTNAARVFKDSESQAKLLLEYENENWPLFPLRVVVSALDKNEMDTRCTNGKVVVVENGVNLSDRRMLADRSPIPRNVIFFGTLDYYPNLDGIFWFLTDVLPVIWSFDQTIQFTIAGRNPPNGLKQLCGDARIKIISNPPDISLAASNSSIAIVPLRIGGGTRLKILDAMSLGLPVISTSVGCEGLDVADQRDILISDDAVSFATAIVSLLDDKELYTDLKKNARALVEQQYTWNNVYRKLEQAILKNYGCKI